MKGSPSPRCASSKFLVPSFKLCCEPGRLAVRGNRGPSRRGRIDVRAWSCMRARFIQHFRNTAVGNYRVGSGVAGSGLKHDPYFSGPPFSQGL